MKTSYRKPGGTSAQPSSSLLSTTTILVSSSESDESITAMYKPRDIISSMNEAIRNCRIETAETLIATYGFSYAEEWENGYGLFLKALKEKAYRIASLFLEKGAQTFSNDAKSNRYAPLRHSASIFLERKWCELFLEKMPGEMGHNDDKNAFLFFVVSIGDTKLTSLILDHWASVNIMDKANKTPLHIAVENYDEEIAKLLLLNGADVDALNDRGETALYSAVKRKHVEMVRLILKYYPDLCHESNRRAVGLAVKSLLYRVVWDFALYGFSVLPADPDNLILFDIYHGDVDRLDMLLKRFGSLEKSNAIGKDMASSHNYKQIGLYYALKFNKVSAVEMLLDYGADVDGVDSDGTSLMCWATMYQNREILKLFLKKTKESIQPEVLSAAVENNNVSILDMLLKHGANANVGIEEFSPLIHTAAYEGFQDTTLLHRAAYEGFKEIAELLIRNGASVNAVNRLRQTPLHVAVSAGKLNIVQLLLKSGAFVDARDKGGNTPLILAGRVKSREFAQCLLEFGANLNGFNRAHVSAIINAVIARNVDLVRFFLEKGAKVNSRDGKRNTGLILACKQKDEKCAECFLEFGANVNAFNNKLLNAIHFAVQKKHLKLVKLLLVNRANVNARDGNGRTPLLLACELEDDEFAECLIEFGADVEMGNGNYFASERPLHKACRHMNVNVVRVLLSYGADVNHRYMDEYPAALTECRNDIYRLPNCGKNNALLPLILLIVKMQCAGMYVCQENLDAVALCNFKRGTCTYTDEFYEALEKEVVEMKKDSIGDFDLPIYEILTAGEDDLLKLLKNCAFRDSVWSVDYEEKYPYYYDMLTSKIEIAEKKLELQEVCHSFFDVVYPTLPFICAAVIDEYLSVTDRRMLLCVCNSN